MKEKMETLIFAIIASYNAQRQQECVVTESQKFQPFDLQALRIPQTTCQTDSASRLEAFVFTNRMSSAMQSFSAMQPQLAAKTIQELRTLTAKPMCPG
jgi:hypothetical protein